MMSYDADLAADNIQQVVEYLGYCYKQHRTRARLLAEIADLPDDTYVSSKHAAAYLGTSPAQLANWRMVRREPPFVRGRARFIRYKLSDLNEYMARRLKDTSEG
jgi:hypothetical protein